MSWAHIVGHKQAIRLLEVQRQKGRLPLSEAAPLAPPGSRLSSAYLFAGSKGIGKSLLATEFAKAVTCRENKESACDQCDSCREIAQAFFPDFKVIRPESEGGRIGIDRVRELLHWIGMLPSDGPLRIALLDGADSMTEEALHACLKLLEEPPPQSLILVVTQALQRLPATFISRCHLVRCLPQGIDQVVRFLRETKGLDEAAARILGNLSGGRMGKALSFHEKEDLSIKNEALAQLLGAFRQKSVELPLSSAPRAELERALEWLAAWCRDLMVLKLQGDPKWLVHQDRLKDLQAVDHRSLRIDDLLKRIDRIYGIKEAIGQNVSPRIALAALLSQ